MMDNGDLTAVMSHLISLQRWDRILRRTSQLGQAQAPAQA